MAQRKGSTQAAGLSQRKSRSAPSSASSNGRRNGKADENERPALKALREDNDANREYRAYVRREEEERAGPPDVLLDIPELKIDLIHFELDDLDAHVAVKANVLNLVKLTVGVDVHLSRVKLDIKGVEAEVVLKAHLDHVAAIVDRLMTSLDRNPALIEGLSRAVEQVGEGAGEAVDKTGDAAKDLGHGARSALKDVGHGAGHAVGDIGEGAGQAVGDVGQGAGQAVGDVGQGAGEAVGDVGQGAGQAVGDVGQGAGQAVGDVGQGAGQAVGDVGQGAGQAVGGLGQGAGQAVGNLPQTVGNAGQAAGQAGQGVGQAVGGLTQGVGQAGQAVGQAAGGLTGGLGGGQGQDGGAAQDGGANAVGADQPPSTKTVAKEVAKMVARQIGHAASDEARDISFATARKVRELGERREQRRAQKYEATAAAVRMADERGIDLGELRGTGSEGRITVKDVREAAEAS
jgi:hypothetical protein